MLPQKFSLIDCDLFYKIFVCLFKNQYVALEKKSGSVKMNTYRSKSSRKQLDVNKQK